MDGYLSTIMLHDASDEQTNVRTDGRTYTNVKLYIRDALYLITLIGKIDNDNPISNKVVGYIQVRV